MTTFNWKSSGMSITSTLRVVEPKSFIAWTGKTFGTEAIHIWQLKQEGSTVKIVTEESFDGWLPRLLPSLMQSSLDAAIIKWLEILKHTAEIKS